MRFRLLIALAVVLALVFGGGLFAQAGIVNDDDPHCWWVGYSISIMGAKPIKVVPKSCVPCLRLCDLLPTAAVEPS